MEISASFRFKENIIDFLDFMAELIRESKTHYELMVDVNIVEWMINLAKIYDSEKLVQMFIKNSSIYWDEIYEESENYFVNEFFTIFSNNPSNNKQLYFTYLRDFLEKRKENYNIDKDDERYDPYIISKDDRKIIWDFLKSFVRISIQYAHETSLPEMKDDKLIYLDKKYNLDLNYLANKWNLRLTV